MTLRSDERSSKGGVGQGTADSTVTAVGDAESEDKKVPSPRGRYLRFLAVGMSNAVVDVGVFNGCLLLSPSKSSFSVLLYNSIAVICAIINSYIWNRRWTFRDVSKGTNKERGLFALQGVLNIVLNNLILYWLSLYLILVREIPFFISSNVAKGIAMMLASSISFVFMRFFVFRGRSGAA